METKRLELQTKLDLGKTILERNKLGQFSTPGVLAQDLVSFGLKLIKEDEVRFLDPAFGTGAFYSALINQSGINISAAAGFEIDPHYGLPSQNFWENTPLELEIIDFTKKPYPEEGFNLLICNPPYVRHHHILSEDKFRLKEQSYFSAGIKLSGLAGLYCHFLVQSLGWMSPGGIAGWLIPSEFMDVNYGQELKKLLLEKVTLLKVHRFEPEDVQFKDALVSSAVVWFKNQMPSGKDNVEFSIGGSHETPIYSRHISLPELKNERKWTRFPRKETRSNEHVVVLSDLFTIKRGIATGNNEFFILNREKIKLLDLPMEQFRPILPSPRYMQKEEIEADPEGNPIIAKQLFLLDCRLPEEEVQRNFPSLWHYLEQGKQELISRYICKNRPLWYKQEERTSTPFICTYMGRGDGKSKNPFRFFLNHSKAIVANSYLMLYPKQLIATAIKDNPELTHKIWENLRSIPKELLTDEGRVYGGGLHKMEPKELANVPCDKILKLLNAVSK